MKLEKRKLLEMYQQMVRIRLFEDRVSKEFATGNIPGFVHLYVGEEASAVGACSALREDDYIISTHRGHGHLIAKGGKTDRMMAELYGRETGYNNGKGGSMHIADMDIGILGANGIVGGGIPIAGGAALSAKMRDTDQVALCFLGDGATNTSRFHEGVNLAACWKLPVIYLIENNGYAESTRITDVCLLENLADRSVAYGIPGVTVDGNNVLEVHEKVSEAVARARKGDGPTLVETKVYRYHGHFEGDSSDYKPEGELDSWMEKDCINSFRKQLIKDGVFMQAEADKIDHEMEDEIKNAVKFASESEFPDPEEALKGVYA